MTFYEKGEDWLHQSALLLEARPETTRITTRYHIKPSWRTTKKRPVEPSSAAASKPPRGHLILKTYDPASGVTLKYKTSKAAEVSRLVQLLGSLGRPMAALPPIKQEDHLLPDADAVGEGSGAQTPVPGAGAPAPGTQSQGQAQQGGGGGGKGKKKKGKR